MTVETVSEAADEVFMPTSEAAIRRIGNPRAEDFETMSWSQKNSRVKSPASQIVNTFKTSICSSNKEPEDRRPAIKNA